MVGLFLENLIELDYQLITIDINPGDFQFNYAEFHELQELVEKSCKLSDDAIAQQSGLHIIKDEVFLIDTTEKLKYEMLRAIEPPFG